MCFEVQAQKPFFQYPPFLAPRSLATRVKAKTQKYFSKYLYLIFRKSQEVSNQYLYRFRSSIICKKSLGAKRPPPLRIGLSYMTFWKICGQGSYIFKFPRPKAVPMSSTSHFFVHSPRRRSSRTIP